MLRMDFALSPPPIPWLLGVIRILQGLLGTVEKLGLMAGPELMLVFGRLGRIVVQMDRLAARFRAGTLVVRGKRAVVAAVEDVKKTRRAPEVLWPRKPAWLVAMVGYQAAGMGSQLRAMLQTPEMVELLLAGPQAGRILRPLCRMLGVETSYLDPRLPEPVFVPKAVPVRTKRVRAKRAPIDWGNIPLPRGTLAYAKRLGFKPVR